MNNRLIKMAAVALALLALTGCGAAKTLIEEKAGNALGKTVGQLQNLAGTEGDQPGEEDSEENGNEDTPEYNEKTNVDDCMKGCGMLTGTGMFSKEFCADSCWAAVAKDTGDVSVCDTKVSKDNGLVLFACYMNVAETTKDPKYCDKIGDNANDLMRGGCYGNIAKLAKDPSMCEAIKGNMMYDSCITDAKDGE